jgi:hypothetical protein
MGVDFKAGGDESNPVKPILTEAKILDSLYKRCLGLVDRNYLNDRRSKPTLIQGRVFKCLWGLNSTSISLETLAKKLKLNETQVRSAIPRINSKLKQEFVKIDFIEIDEESHCCLQRPSIEDIDSDQVLSNEDSTSFDRYQVLFGIAVERVMTDCFLDLDDADYEAERIRVRAMFSSLLTELELFLPVDLDDLGLLELNSFLAEAVKLYKRKLIQTSAELPPHTLS